MVMRISIFSSLVLNEDLDRRLKRGQLIQWFTNKNMEAYSEAYLDDIRARSERLERQTPFIINLPLPTLLHQTKNILSSIVTNEDKDATNGQLLIPGLKGDIITTKTLLDSINTSQITQDENYSFSDRTSFCFQSSIVRSLEKAQIETNILNEDFVFSSLSNQMKEKEAALHRILGQTSPASVPFCDLYSINPPADAKMTLTPKAQFYVNHLRTDDGYFASNLAKAIRNSDQDNFSGDYQRVLADTYELINCILENSSYKTSIGSIRFLEKQFKKFITYEVNTNLRNAARGGEIGIINTIKGYLNYTQEPFRDSPYAVLFYTIRCGEYSEALNYVVENVELFDRDVKFALQALVNQVPMSRETSQSLQIYDNTSVTSSTFDPFKILTLAVLIKGRIPDDLLSKAIFNDETDKKNSIFTGPHTLMHFKDAIENWIWFNLLRTDDLKSLFKEVENLKENEDTANPFMFGQILLLLGRYKKATKWFLSCQENLDDNLHIVLTMHISHIIDSSLIINDLLQQSIDVFRADKIAAVRYLSYLRDRSSRVGAIAHLAVETANGETIFMPLDGGLSPVALVLRADEQEESIIAAACEAESLGQHGRAAFFYKLANKYEQVIDLECIELRQYIDEYLDEDAVINASDICEEIQANAPVVLATKLNALHLLLNIAAAKVYYTRKDYNAATKELIIAGIIPSSSDQIEQCYRRIMDFAPIVKQIIPNALIIALHTYFEIYKLSPQTARKEITEKADILIELAGRPEINTPSEAIRELLNLHQDFI